MNHTTRFALVLILASILLLGLDSSASASQQPGHIYMALVALEAAPQSIRSMLAANTGHYTAGATGPDVALLAYPFREAAGLHHPGSLPHYEKTGQLITNMMRRAKNDEERAFVLGWMTHYWVDCAIHPLVNDFGGYYTGPEALPKAQDRHRELELFEAKHVLHHIAPKSYSRPGTLAFYRVRSSQVPTSLISRAMVDTYIGDGWLDWNRFRFISPPLAFALWGGAGLMQRATAWMVNQELETPGLIDPAISSIMGKMPTTEEYGKLMDPLRVISITVAPGQSALRVAYRVDDIRLLRAFADAWQPASKTAVSRILRAFDAWATDPKGLMPLRLRLADLNLDTGMGEKEEYWGNDAFPGNPEIRRLLVTCVITDSEGKELAVWPSPGSWVPLAELDEEVWGGPAGSGSFDIPLPQGVSGRYEVDLTVEFARESDRRPYGVKGRGQGTVTVGTAPAAEAKPPEPKPEPPEYEVTGATAGRFTCMGGFYGTIEQVGVGRNEPSWGPRELVPSDKRGYGVWVRPEKGFALTWSGLQFSASWVYEMYGHMYEDWLQGAVSEAGDSVVWIEAGQQKVKPDDAGDDWYPDEVSWRAEGIPLEMTVLGPTRTQWYGKLQGDEALRSLVWYRQYSEVLQRGNYGGHTVLITHREWPGNTDPKMGELSVEFLQSRD